MVTPITGHKTRTDLYQINNITQNNMLTYPKELVIGLLRDEFRKDSFYHYVSDEWGFPKVIALKDKELSAGYSDDETTRIFIGESWHYDGIFYPSILVKGGGVNSVPLSISRNKYVVDYDKELLVDDYGNESLVFVPTAYDLAGAWEGSLSVDVVTRDMLSRDELISFLMIFFTDIAFDAMVKAGVVVKKANASGPSEGEDRNQEKLYKQSVTLDIRTEWRRRIPILSVIDQINFCANFVDFNESNSPNIEINTNVNLLDALNSL